MISPVHPALIFILGAILLPVVPGRRAKQVLLLLIPVVALADLLFMPLGTYWSTRFLTYSLVFARVDKLSLCFGYAFAIVALLSALYALHVKQYGQHSVTFSTPSIGRCFSTCWRVSRPASAGESVRQRKVKEEPGILSASRTAGIQPTQAGV